MSAQKVQRTLASVGLIALTVFFAILWLLGWFVFEDPGMTEQGFYMAGVFLAATLVYWGVRASIYE